MKQKLDKMILKPKNNFILFPSEIADALVLKGMKNIQE